MLNLYLTGQVRFGARLAQCGDESLPVLVIQKNQLPTITAIQRGCDAPVAESAGDASSPATHYGNCIVPANGVTANREGGGGGRSVRYLTRFTP